jgi:hypothetical protein
MRSVASWGWVLGAGFVVLLAGCPESEEPSGDKDMAAADMGADMTGDMGEMGKTVKVSAIDPAGGPLTGGTLVTVTGEGFAAGAKVFFGAREGGAVEVVSATQLKVSSPAGESAATVDVRVVNADRGEATLPGAFRYTGEDTQVYCRLQAQSPAQAVVGAPSSALYAVLFARGVTEGSGAGAGITAELGAGMGTDAAAFDYVPMAYNVDKDGLGVGDKANDEYGASLTFDATGTYRYVARFKAAGLAEDWVYCDLDGSDNAPSADQLGTINVGEALRPTIEFCQLQAQSPATARPGEPSDALYAIVYSPGITQGDGAGANIEAQLGFGPSGDEAGFEGFSYTAMAYNADKDGIGAGDKANDEYGAPLSVPAAGDYRYVARFRVASPQSDWLYCDLKGTGPAAPFDPAQMGVLKVEAPAAPRVAYCRTESTQASVAPGQSTGELTGELFVAGVTNAMGQGAGVMAELVWGPSAAAPSTWTNRVTAGYKGDAAGLDPNNPANDRYAAVITPAMEGDFGFAYRFSVDGGTTWSLCDTDGSDGTAAGFEDAKVGELAVANAAPPSVAFCQTETVSARVAPGQATSALRGQLYVPGVTQGAGAGAGVQGRVLWGPRAASPATWTTSAAATYLEDEDGLVPGAKANDRYTAVLTPAMEGDFGYVYQFSLDGGANWSSCDTDGSDGTAAGFEAAKAGELTVQAASRPDDCRIQFPFVVTEGVVGQQWTIYGRVREAGVTDVGDDAAQVKGELWVGPIDADPVTEAMRFTKVPAQFNPMVSGQAQDEYQASWTATAAGSYQFFYSFSVDAGATWTLCDIDGASGPASFSRRGVGVIEVSAAAPNVVDYCHVYNGSVTKSLSMAADPVVTMELFEGGVTEGNNGANSAQVTVELGYGAAGLNPAMPMAYTWSAAPYVRTAPGRPNNYEYEGVPYAPATPPAAGSYKVAARVKLAGQTAWRYCDNLQSSGDFLPEFLTTLSVTP